MKFDSAEYSCGHFRRVPLLRFVALLSERVPSAYGSWHYRHAGAGYGARVHLSTKKLDVQCPLTKEMGIVAHV